jgi:gliding motility-associated-like protein
LTGETLASLRITQGGNYKVISTNSNGCKSSSLVKAVIENPLPVGTFDAPATLNICEGSSLTLSASGASTYQWFYNNTAILGATAATYKATAAGSYSVDFISNKGCLAKGINSYTLNLLKQPDAIFSFDNYCAGVQTNFSNKSLVSQSGLVRYFWQFGDGKVSSNGQNAFNTYTTAGNYRAKLIVTPVECPQLADSAEALIAVENPPAGIAYPPVNAIINRAQQLTARNIGITYQWTPSSYLTSSTSRTPTITTSKEQLYFIYIKNQAGCNIVDTQLVRVFPDRNIYVPEGFTPDNDGHNDRLYPILVGISEMRVFKIFNRWGTLVFDNKNATVNTGWNGTFQGRTQPIDTYAWVAEGIDVDGKLVTRTGNTILIR